MFCDIGSGIGGVVISAALIRNVSSIGIEISQVGHNFATQFL